ncbi:hypothetical protein quinque_011573 [Culex quinquefasciatus]
MCVCASVLSSCIGVHEPSQGRTSTLIQLVKHKKVVERKSHHQQAEQSHQGKRKKLQFRSELPSPCTAAIAFGVFAQESLLS